MEKRAVILTSLVLILGALLLGATFWSTEARADLTIANGPDPRSLDPALAQSTADLRVAASLFVGLVSPDPRTLEPRPALAKSWSASANGQSWTFQLRENLKWSDGTPLVAAEVVWSYLRFLDPGTGTRLGDLLDCVRGARHFRETGQGRDRVGIVAPDDRTLHFQLDRRTPYFLDVLGQPPLGVVPRHVIESRGLGWTRPEHFVSAGPYRLVTWRLRDRVRVRRNPLYFDAAGVAFDTVDFRAVENAATMLNLFITGGVDFATDVPPGAVPALLARYGASGTREFLPAPRLGTFFLRVNCRRPPFTNPKLRAALSYSIDREAIVSTVTRAGEPACRSFVPDGVRAGEVEYQSARTLSFDPGRAAELLSLGLAEEGLTQLPSFELLYSPEPGDQAIAELLQSRWASLGINCRLVGQDGASIRDALKRLDYTVARSSWLGDYNDPSTFLDQYRTGSPGNRTGWSSEVYDGLLARAASEADSARAATLKEAETHLLAQSPILPIYHYVSRNLVSQRLAGYFSNVMDWHPPSSLSEGTPR